MTHDVDPAFDHAPNLADALEDASCTNQDIVFRCCGGGEHIRGRWVVDALIGKVHPAWGTGKVADIVEAGIHRGNAYSPW